jgi:hypothetical protein
MSTEDIQPLLERIHREGLRKAEEERDALLAKAKAEAARLRADAEIEALTLRQAARADAEAATARGKAALEQAARDVLLRLRAELGRQVQVAARTALRAPLAAPELVAGLLRGLVAARGPSGEVTVMAGSDLHKGLQTLLPSLLRDLGRDDGVHLEMNPKLESGFQLRFGSEPGLHDFSDEAVSAWLASHLRPELAALLAPPAQKA